MSTATVRATTPASIAQARNGAGIVTSSLVIARRSVLKFLRTPQLVVAGSVQGAMFLLIFRYVFGGAISTGSVSYVDFLVPGFVTTGVLFTGMLAAVGIAEDLQDGFIQRLRSLPIPRSAVLIGRAVADTGFQIWGLSISVAVGFAVGFRIHEGVPEAFLALALIVLFGIVFEWMFILVGVLAGNAQAAQGLAMITFPLTFISSAYVPVSTMPSWLQGVAANQPLTMMVDAVRGLTTGTAGMPHDVHYYVAASLIWSAGLIAVFAPIAAARFRRT